MSNMTTESRYPELLKPEPIFRITQGSGFSHIFSTGFLDKSGQREDVTHEHYDRLAMVYLLHGSGTYTDDTGQHIQLQAGDVFFRKPDRRHTTTIDPESGWQECFVALRYTWFELFTHMGIFPAELVRIKNGPGSDIPSSVQVFMRRLHALDTPADNADVEFQIAALIRSTLTSAMVGPEDDTHHKQVLNATRELIRTRAEESLSIENLLSRQGISYSRLRSLFRQSYGITPGEYRIRVRIERASALLSTTTLSVSEIASQLGYADAFAFSKQFKQRTGFAPVKFRQRLS